MPVGHSRGQGDGGSGCAWTGLVEGGSRLYLVSGCLDHLPTGTTSKAGSGNCAGGDPEQRPTWGREDDWAQGCPHRDGVLGHWVRAGQVAAIYGKRSVPSPGGNRGPCSSNTQPSKGQDGMEEAQEKKCGWPGPQEQATGPAARASAGRRQNHSHQNQWIFPRTQPFLP